MKIKLLNFLSLGAILMVVSAFTPSPENQLPVRQEDNPAFYQFLSQFEKVELPYEIGIDQMQQYDAFRDQHASQQKRSIGTPSKNTIRNSPFIPELQRKQFSRMGPPIVEPVARFYPNENSIAVIYSTSNRYSSTLHKSYRLLVFDLKGHLLYGDDAGKKKLKSKTTMEPHIAYSSPEETVTLKIDRQGRILKTTYENVWKKELSATSFVDNYLIGFEEQEAMVYEINRQGALVEVQLPTKTVRASLN